MKKKDIYDRENITLCLINQYWDEKDINLNLSLIIMNLIDYGWM